MNDIIHLTNTGVGAVEIGINLYSRVPLLENHFHLDRLIHTTQCLATSGRRHRITSYGEVFHMYKKDLYFLFKQNLFQGVRYERGIITQWKVKVIRTTKAKMEHYLKEHKTVK